MSKRRKSDEPGCVGTAISLGIGLPLEAAVVGFGFWIFAIWIEADWREQSFVIGVTAFILYVAIRVFWSLVIRPAFAREPDAGVDVSGPSRAGREPIPPGLRFDVFQRDGFRCRYCGRSSQEDGVTLHADHVVPASKGGPTTMDNLVTSCQDCNLGKSAKEVV